MILLDRMMPEMDGTELAGRIHADPRHAEVGILMLTSGGSEDSRRSRELGIDAWLARPIRQSDLLGAMFDLIRVERPPASPEPTRASPEAQGRRLQVLLAEDHPINRSAGPAT